MSHAIKKIVSLDYDATLARLPEALKSEGFGVLTEIDVQSTLRAKLDVDFRRYKILGACNPSLAHQALQADLGAGVTQVIGVLDFTVTMDPRTEARTASVTAGTPADKPV